VDKNRDSDAALGAVLAPGALGCLARWSELFGSRGSIGPTKLNPIFISL
jgi:hypothetical protein